jgi:hypothetical protein
MKTSFWKKTGPIKSTTVMKNFFHVRLLCKSLNFMVLGHPSKKPQNYENPCT